MFERKIVRISITLIIEEENGVRKISKKIYLREEIIKDNWLFRRD
ncbi:hypothetical protein NSS70_04300 [Aeribacillus sp. FSL K6-2848]|nr:hypothetical protein [Aeribacillus composti]MED0747202.1 hypothetical protein [Aeribacillus composti]